MPRKRFRRKRRFKKSFNTKRIYKIAKKAAEQVIKTKAEWKATDNNIAMNVTTANTHTSYLSGVTQGVDSDLRIGDEIDVYSIQTKGYITCATAGVNTICRMVMFIDREYNKDAPQVSVWDDLYAIVNPISLRLRESLKRYHVLWDKTWTFANDGANIYAKQRFPFSYYKKFKKPLKVKYSGTTNGAGDMAENSIQVIYLSNQGADYPVITARNRIWFQDL